MGKRQPEEPDSSDENEGPSKEREGNYTPKAYTAWEQFAFGVKLFAIAGLLVLLLWLLDKYV